MDIGAFEWTITLVVILGLLAFDFFFHVRKAHEPSLKEAALWSTFYIVAALLFGLVIWWMDGATYATEYYAGYITEKALSVDNLFVFMVIMGSFAVPRIYQQKVLLFGIVFALISRTAFILAGAWLINTLAWMFYIFGLVLLLTAGNLLKGEMTGDNAGDEADNFMVRLAKRVLNTSEEYDRDKLVTTISGKRMFTPMLLVMVAIGLTDLLFAFDSIPAIFGLTNQAYIVFTATAFSLMGLRQLYFLIDGLLDRLVYLSYGLAIILGFIGVKLILHALHENNLPFINDGEPVPVAEVETGVSLIVILAILTVTVVLSLTSKKGRALRVVQNAARYANEYLSLPADADPTERAVKSEKFQLWWERSRELDDRWVNELTDHRDQYLALLHKARGQQINDAG
ncbi:TerC family protein [Micrococcoides hystricis]|uniref:TerC family protein n=1 Tax=Micrococcoides hystricis TaxID=1572761 RepID=A0ABV6P977_9MICC